MRAVRPTLRLLLLVLLAALPLAGSALWPALTWVTLAWGLCVVALVAADIHYSARAADWSATRESDARLSVAAWNRVTVTVRLGRGLKELRIWLRDDVPATFEVQGSALVHSAVVAPRQPHQFVYRVRPPRRGRYSFGDLYLRWASPLGLLTRQARIPSTAEIRVYPNLVDVRRYDLLLRNNRLTEMGLRHTRRVDEGSEFARLREYGPDDDFRRISWPATARRGRPVTIEYETERSQNVVAVLDCGRMMRSPVGAVAKMDYAINAVLLLAYVAAAKGDRFGAMTFADRVELWLAPGPGKKQFLRLLDMLYTVEAASIEPDYMVALRELSVRLRRRSLVLLFTDLTSGLNIDSLVASAGRLSRRHLLVVVVIADPAVGRMARAVPIDSETAYERAVAEQLLDERRLALRRLQTAGVNVLDVAADALTAGVINRYMEIKARTGL